MILLLHFREVSTLIARFFAVCQHPFWIFTTFAMLCPKITVFIFVWAIYDCLRQFVSVFWMYSHLFWKNMCQNISEQLWFEASLIILVNLQHNPNEFSIYLPSMSKRLSWRPFSIVVWEVTRGRCLFISSLVMVDNGFTVEVV